MLVIDRATYHTTLTKETQPAKLVYNNAGLVDWILAKQLQIEVRGVVLKARDDYAQASEAHGHLLTKQAETSLPSEGAGAKV